MWVLVAAIFYFGVTTEWTVGIAQQAAESLLGVVP
jgi:hypothetical protein